MTPEELRACPAPPEGVPPVIVALWHDAAGDWGTAHRIVQDLEGAGAARVHAYLHRKEGDAGNAAYWYRRAGRSAEAGPLPEEWDRLVEELTAPPGGQQGRTV